MAQVVEYLTTKCEALSSSTTKKRKEKKKRRKGEGNMT
jgi:hypothetical protein